jgi:hypothetical protein
MVSGEATLAIVTDTAVGTVGALEPKGLGRKETRVGFAECSGFRL